MIEIMIKLDAIADVKDFVALVESECTFPVDLCSGRYVVDAKSIMGIYSLDLMNPIKLVAYTEDENAVKKLRKYAI